MHGSGTKRPHYWPDKIREKRVKKSKSLTKISSKGKVNDKEDLLLSKYSKVEYE